MVVFIGRNRRRIKILFADATGLWLASKRFTDYAMKTSFKFLSDPKVTAITSGELHLMCDGVAYKNREEASRPTLLSESRERSDHRRKKFVIAITRLVAHEAS
jgi:hypothetical protein